MFRRLRREQEAKKSLRLWQDLSRSAGMSHVDRTAALREPQTNGQVALGVARHGVAVLTKPMTPAWFPSSGSREQKRGARHIRRAISRGEPQRAALLLTHALPSLAAAGSPADVAAYHLEIRDQVLPGLFPLNQREEELLNRCMLVGRINARDIDDLGSVEPQELPARYAVALDAGTPLPELAEAVGDRRDFDAWAFFCCEAFHGAMQLLCGNGDYTQIALLMPRWTVAYGLVNPSPRIAGVLVLLELWDLALQDYADTVGTPAPLAPPLPAPDVADPASGEASSG